MLKKGEDIRRKESLLSSMSWKENVLFVPKELYKFFHQNFFFVTNEKAKISKQTLISYHKYNTYERKSSQ